MLRVKDGDRDAFEALVEKYKQPVMNLAFRTLADATEGGAHELLDRIRSHILRLIREVVPAQVRGDNRVGIA